MANRYTNEGRDPRDIYDDSENRGEYRDDRNFSRGRRYNDTANRRYPSFRDRSSYGGENYFGSGRQGYGDGIEDYEPNHSFGSSWRDSTGNSNYETPDQRYESTRRRAGFGRDAYGLGYGGDWEPEANRRRYENQEYDRGLNEQRDLGRWDKYRDYPSSETGFQNDRTRRGNERSWWDRASDEVSSWFGDDEAERRRQMDERREGGHRGRGPKNYTRSDDRIKEDINDRLTDHDYLDASDIDVEVNAGEVVLSGFVHNRRDKRMAEDIVENITGVKNVENRIRVQQQQNDYAGQNLGYQNVTGHGELNRQEVNATQAENKPETGQARGKTTSS
jgi:osmotically-inducible protein OsmY